MSGKLIIIEGVDGTGKTTLIEGLKKAIHIDYVFNFSYPIGTTIFQEASYAEGEYARSIKFFKQLLKEGKIIVCDRFHMGEFTYGPVKRGYPRWMAKEQLERIEDLLLKSIKEEDIKLIVLGFVVYQAAIGRLKKKEYLKNLEEVKKVNNRYQEAFLLSRLSKWFIYTDVKNVEETLKGVLEYVGV